MTLLRVLHAETLKLKRTIALKMVVIAPAAIGLLVLFMASQAPFSMVRRGGAGHEWAELTRINLLVWGILMLPLFITLETALVAGLDHAENQWKILLARPVPRWTLYVAKLLVVMAMTAASSVVLVCGVLAAGAVLPWIQPELHFGFPIPLAAILRDGAQVTGLAFLALTIQHWVSLRWQSFSVATSVGIVAMVTGYLMVVSTRQTDAWPQYFPLSLPMLVLARRPQNVEAVLWISGAAGLLVAAVGCADFCRREVR